MYRIKEMSLNEAKEYLHWHYEKPYEFYNTPKEYYEESLNEIFSSEEKFYAVYKNDVYFGIFSFREEDNKLELGLGIKPEECGKGYGEEFVLAGIKFIRETLNFPGKIWLRVKDSNERALKVYEKTHFKKVDEKLALSYGTLVNFIHLELRE